MDELQPSEVAGAVDFSDIRYALCWEDADILLEALDVQPGDTCLSIVSAGDNTLSLLTRDPGKVVAVDLSAAQLACLEIRIAAYRHLDHPRLLALVGAVDSGRRLEIYATLRRHLSSETRAIWDARPRAISAGIGTAGKFERYIRMFRRYVLPLIHSRRGVEKQLEPRSEANRRRHYYEHWANWRWRVLVKLFCSRAVASRLGRDPEFFRYVNGNVADRVLARAEFALTDLDPAANPYIRWIVTGRYGHVLPHALRAENFEPIRRNLDRLELRLASLEAYLAAAPDRSIDRFNLSDVFEYVSAVQAARMFGRIARVGRPGGRLAYWNTFVPRARPESLANQLRPLCDLAERLHRLDKAFFYDAFRVEEVL